MPLFEYRCASCENQFELLIRPGSAEPACPACGSTSIAKLLSMFAVSSAGTQQRSRQILGAQQRKDQQRRQLDNWHDDHDDHHHTH